MGLAQPGWSFRRKLGIGLALLIICCAVGLFLLDRSIRNIDFSKVKIYKEGVGPSYEETLAGGTD